MPQKFEIKPQKNIKINTQWKDKKRNVSLKSDLGNNF